MVLFLVATNRYFPPEVAVLELGQGDVRSYHAIASAAPALPEEAVPAHRGARFTGPYLVGLAARVAGIDQDLAFRVAVALLVLATGLAVARALRRLHPDPWLRATLLGFVLLHASAFRYPLAFPYMLPDPAFVAGSAVAVLGLMGGSGVLLLAGWTVAAVSRQTTLLLLPMVLLWLTAGSPWRERPRAHRVLLGVAATGILVAAQLGSSLVAARFASPTDLGAVAFGVILYLREWPPGAAAALADLVVRPLAAFLPFLAFVWLFPGKTTARWREGCLLLLGALALAAQPLAAGPLVNAGNHVRLVNLAIVPLVLGGASFLAPASPRRGTLLLVGFLLALASFHHRWTAAGARLLAEPPALLAMQGAVAAAIAVVLLLERRRGAPSAPAPG